VTLVGHSYGGAVITNAAHNNPNVTGLFTLPPLLLMRVKLLVIS
jgi:pimeloyl-ACP methyl ester carboxylesterase